MRLETTIESIRDRLKEDRAFTNLRLGSPSIECSCLSALALRRDPRFDEAIHSVLALQNRNGSWPAIAADKPQGCWVTALGILCLLAADAEPARLHRAVRWLLGTKGEEARWLWRWKFRVIDTAVRFDPAKYGWNWIFGTTSWVIPTAFSLIALQQVRRRSLFGGGELAERVQIGIAMLFDRMCPGGGWNAGNGVAFGVGLMQLMPATAVTFGVTNRFVAQDNVRGGVAYLARLLRLFHGDLRLVTAAYLTGEARILSAGLSFSDAAVFEYVNKVAQLYRQIRRKRIQKEQNSESRVEGGNSP